MRTYNQKTPNRSQYYMAVVFTVMAIMSMPAGVFAIFGERIPPEWLDAFMIVKTSLSNAGERSLASNQPLVGEISPGCTTLQRATTTVTIGTTTAPFQFQSLTLALSVMDVLVVTVFLIAATYFSRRVRDVTRGGADEQLSLSQYTVLVRGLPPDATEEQVRDHFSNLYNLAADDWVSCCKCVRRPKLMPDPFDGAGHVRVKARGGANRSLPVRSGRHNRKHGYKGSWVADV